MATDLRDPSGALFTTKTGTGHGNADWTCAFGFECIAFQNSLGQRRGMRTGSGKILWQICQLPEREAEYNVHIISDVFCIKLDPSSTPQGTNGKMIIVTKNSGLKYRKVVEKDAVKLVSGNAEVVFAHTRTTVARGQYNSE